MKFQLELENRAKKELFSLSREIQEKLIEVLDHLEANPRPPGAKKLTGQEAYRVRKGDYRILYTIDDKLGLVRVYRIGHRREIYR